MFDKAAGCFQTSEALSSIQQLLIQDYVRSFHRCLPYIHIIYPIYVYMPRPVSSLMAIHVFAMAYPHYQHNQYVVQHLVDNPIIAHTYPV
jgi:putative effector of murein hydrolase